MNSNEIFNVLDLIDIPASFWPNVSTKMRHTCSKYHNTKKNLNPLFSQIHKLTKKNRTCVLRHMPSNEILMIKVFMN